MNYNKVILAGRLTRDPDHRVTPAGLSICKFSLAVSRHYTSNGQKKEEVAFVEFDAFEKQADLIAKHARKGHSLHTEGRLKLDTWEKNGEKRSRLTVVLEAFQFVGPKPEAQAQGPSTEEDYSGRGD